MLSYSQYASPAALGIAQLYESGRPHSNYFAGLAKNLGIGYTSCIIGLEVLVTSLIASRIAFVGKQFGRSMGPNNVGGAYTSAAAIIVESMLLSTLTGIAYIVTFALGHQLEIFFLSIYVMMTVSPSVDPCVRAHLTKLCAVLRPAVGRPACLERARVDARQELDVRSGLEVGVHRTLDYTH